MSPRLFAITEIAQKVKAKLYKRKSIFLAWAKDSAYL